MLEPYLHFFYFHVLFLKETEVTTENAVEETTETYAENLENQEKPVNNEAVNKDPGDYKILF